METLSGKLLYRERIALPEGADVRVRIVDISQRDAPAVPIAEKQFTTSGEQPPLSFRLEYDPQDIKETHDYAVEASITIDGKLEWTTSQQPDIFSNTSPPAIMDVNLVKVR